MRYILLLTLLLIGNHLFSQELRFIDTNKFSIGLTQVDIKFKDSIITEHMESQVLRCYLIRDGKKAQQPILGSYSWVKEELRFNSAVTPSEGATIECSAFINGKNRKLGFNTARNNAKKGSPIVTSVYPTSGKVPLNILFFYFEFDQPMDPDFFDYQALKLIDENGKEKKQVWRHEVNWDSENKVAAVMIHPGRVKLGIDYQEEEGDVFKLGEHVQLIVGKVFRSVQGEFPEQKFTKSYEISHRDTVLPEYVVSMKETPRMGTKENLIIKFSETMCFGSVIRGIVVHTDIGDKIEGQWNSTDQEKTWQFTPQNNWEKGSYSMTLNEYPADLALNTIHQPFELSQSEKPGDFESIIKIQFLVE